MIINGQARVCATGTYVGDASDNKMITHNLGRVPKLIVITNTTNTNVAFINYLGRCGTQGVSWHDLTAPTATTFYVGLAASYTSTANLNLVNYYYHAIG